jgi:hypothetical protein
VPIAPTKEDAMADEQRERARETVEVPAPEAERVTQRGHDNMDQAERIRTILREHFALGAGTDPGTALGDLLACVYHFCREEGLTFEGASRRGAWHFLEEVEEAESEADAAAPDEPPLPLPCANPHCLVCYKNTAVTPRRKDAAQ